MFLYPPAAALALALSTISQVMSTPMTFPLDPTFSAARKQSNPAPDPRSRTLSPSLIDARAMGFPQPRPRFDPVGTADSSSSE
jgi:hypothetical protein